MGWNFVLWGGFSSSNLESRYKMLVPTFFDCYYVYTNADSRGNTYIGKGGITDMANTRKILLSLHTEVADKLAEEQAAGKNKSAIVDALVAAHYGLSFEGDSKAATERQSVLDSFKTDFVEEVPTEVSEDAGNDFITEPVPVLSPIVDDSPVVAEPVEHDGGDVQPVEQDAPEVETVPEEVPAETPAEVPNDGFVRIDAITEPAANPDLVPVADGAAVDQELVEAISPAPEAASLSEADGTANLEVIPAEPTFDVVEPLLSDPAPEVPTAAPELPEVTVGDQPVPVHVAAEPAPAVDAVSSPTCPTCGDIQLTPICLNCL